MDLKLFLEELFGCRVDLVLTGSINPGLRATILRETVYAAGSIAYFDDILDAIGAIREYTR